MEASSESGRDVIATVRKAYPELGRYLYFDMAPGTHSVLYELQNKRLNWLWYINQAEPPLKVHLQYSLCNLFGSRVVCLPTCLPAGMHQER